MEVIPLRDMPVNKAFQKVSQIIHTIQLRYEVFDRFYIIEMVPENGALLLGWRKVPPHHAQLCREHVLKMLGK
jgi:hypothetical protein